MVTPDAQVFIRRRDQLRSAYTVLDNQRRALDALEKARNWLPATKDEAFRADELLTEIAVEIVRNVELILKLSDLISPARVQKEE